ncbi:MAG: hypothetical protein RL084_704, partial [Pseudomonadota bacterium]
VGARQLNGVYCLRHGFEAPIERKDGAFKPGSRVA